MTEQEAILNIQKFRDRLVIVNENKYRKGINFFDAVGMSNLETKHSRFFVWLFRSDKPHNFKNNETLTMLCEKLFEYQTEINEKPHNYKSNKEILSSIFHCNKVEDLKTEDLIGLIDGKITVTPEVKIDTKKSNSKENRRYIDILIETEKAVFVIENKTGSDTHTDQLQAYQDYVDANYQNLKKIFIFLSPEGLLPYNKGGSGDYNTNWCVFDYNYILKIVRALLGKVKANEVTYDTKAQKEKMIILLEDYIEMVETDILKESAAVRAECKNILDDKKLKETFDMLQDYMERIASYERVLKHAKRWMLDNFKSENDADGNDIVICKENPKSFVCFTQKMIDFFKTHGETDYKNRWRCYFAVGGSDELVVFFQLYKTDKMEWSTLQKDFMKRYSSLVGQEKTQVTVEPAVTLSAPIDRTEFLENIIGKIDTILKDKIVVALKSFESKLLNLYNDN